jgi:hypothetical protein
MMRQLLFLPAILVLSATGAPAGDVTYGNDYVYAPESSPASASSGIFGDLNLSGTYTNGDVAKEYSLDLGGSAVLPFGSGWNAALDYQLGYRFEADDWFAAGTGHLFYNNGSAAGGAFVHADTDETYGGGVEAAAFAGNVDLIGEIGYFNASADYWSAAGTANLYFDPDTALSGMVGGSWGDASGWQGDVGIEHRFTNSPFSGFAEIGYSDLGAANSYHVTGGARFVFGDSGSTLQEFNRRNPF